MDLITSHENKSTDALKLLLSSGKFSEVKFAIESQEYFEEVKDNCGNIITIFANHINEETRKDNFELFECCESVIYSIAKLADPNDCLIEFIECAEKQDEELFMVMLKALRISLMKIIDKNDSSLTWCLSTIVRHMNDMPQTDDFKLEGDEYVILENSDSSRTVISMYKEIFNFLEPVIQYVISSGEDYDSENRNIVLTFLVKLLGRPLVYMRLGYQETKGEFRLIAEHLLSEVIKFKVELTHFLNFVISYNPQRKTTITDIVDLDYNNVSLGVLYYLVFIEGLCLDNVSHVYHPLFILQTFATLSLDMLIIEHSSVQNKGLLLLEYALKRIVDLSLDFSHIQCELFGKVSERLSQIIVYSDVKENRIIGVRVFRLLLEKFNSKGRFYILYNIQIKETHPNFIGFITTIAKDFVITALENRQPLDLEYFTGPNLRTILTKFCKLHKGAESDLIELADQITASLNFVRFLLLRDKDNSLGLTEFIPHLEKNYLEPLKTGLSLSVAHYKLQKTELANAAPDEKFNVTVSGLELPSLSMEQKLSILDSALNTFDLIEALVVRVEECLHEYKQKA